MSKDQTLEEDKNASSGAAEIARPLKGLATLSEDLGFSSQYSAGLQPPVTAGLGDLTPSSGL